MTADDRTVAFINSLDRGNTEFLNRLEQEALSDGVPIIRRETQALLRVLLQMKQPHKILEVGTAVGFSALLMEAYAPEDAKITTIEKYEKRIPVALQNFRRAGKEEKITLLTGDAMDILKELKESYDFIFMDAAKAQYIHFFPEVMRLLSCGGVLVSDNVLQDGDIIESKFAVTRRDRTIHKRMREYLYSLMNHEELVTTILRAGDGAAVSVRKGSRE